MKLKFQMIDEDTKELLPERTYEFIRSFDKDKQIRVAEIDPAYADGDSLSREYELPYEMELNCLVIEGRRGEDISHAAVLVPYGKRVSMNTKVRGPLNAKEVKFADLEYVMQKTGMEYGSITPIGLPDDWKILIDASVFDQEEVIVGGGLVRSKLILPSVLFREMTNCEVIEGLAKDR